MLRLYDSRTSGNCYKVRLLLAHLGIPYEPVEMDVVNREKRVEQLGDKNPAAKIPILELEDGRCIAESNAILWHLADGTKYLSADPFERVKTLQWLFFEQNNLEVNVAVARYWIHVLKDPERFREPLKIRQSGGRAALAAMERFLAKHPFFVADRYSIADISLYGYTHVARDGGFDLDAYPAVGKWIGRVREQPGHIRLEDLGTAAR
ncbi:MAG: glutathione S-transferase family protein [Acidobacteria bacterium]|nr:glutathione S-transferase family protein [Acidobacteriota bacterium]